MQRCKRRNGQQHVTATHHLYFMFIDLFYTVVCLSFNYLFRLCLHLHVLHLHLLHLSLIRGRLRSRSGFIPQNRIENMTANAPAMTNTSPISIPGWFDGLIKCLNEKAFNF
jgi:hypothetical protein